MTPGGMPQNPPPYAGPQPPPARRFGFGAACMLATLGCGLVGTLMLLGMGLFAVRAVRHIATEAPAISVQQAQRLLPPGVPLYPGLTLDARQSGLLQSGQTRIEINGQPRAVDQKWTAYVADTDLATVGGWYARELKARGWRPDGPQVAGIYTFRRGDTVFAVAGPLAGLGLPFVGGHLYLMTGTAAGQGIRPRLAPIPPIPPISPVPPVPPVPPAPPAPPAPPNII